MNRVSRTLPRPPGEIALRLRRKRHAAAQTFERPTFLRLRTTALAVAMAIALATALTTVLAQTPVPDDRSAAQRIFADAAPDDLIRIVEPGDSLEAIARRELDSPRRWIDIARYNTIRNPSALRVGSAIRIRPEWLKSDAVVMKVEAIGGAATIDGLPATRDSKPREGSVLATSANGTIELTLQDGTRLRIPPASEIKVERLRAYHGNAAVDARFRLDSGGVEAQSPPARTYPLEIRSPSGNAAVRGTDFRVRSEPDNGFIEVLTGAIAADSRAGNATIRRLEGGVVSPIRAPLVEDLLPAPALAGLDGQRFASTALEIAVAPVPRAAAYRIDLARDPAFIDVVRSFRQPGPNLRIETDRDGDLFLRVRGVSAVGLEGVDAQARLQIAARPVPPAPIAPRSDAGGGLLAGPITVAWNDARPGLRYRVQLAADTGFRELLDDRVVDTTSASLTLPAVAAGMRYWRVASIEGASGREGPWSEPVAFSQRDPAPILRAVPTPVWRDSRGEPVGIGSGGALTPGY